MKERILATILLTIAVLGVSSCDFARRAAGRPTSADIQVARTLRIREVAAEKALAESLKADSLRKAAAADSLRRVALADSVAMVSSNVVFRKASVIGRMAPLEKPYYISLGIFRNKSNAEPVARAAAKAGYEVTIGRCGPCDVVLICGSETIVEALGEYAKVSGRRFCPKDAFILISNK